MKSINPLAAAIIITISTALVLAHCIWKPDYATFTLAIYVSSLLFMSIILSIAAWIYKNQKSSLSRGQISEITEDLNTEMIIWADDFSYVFINKKLRELLGINETDSEMKPALFKAFGLSEPDRQAIEKVINTTSYETKFKDASGADTIIAWSTSLVKKTKKCSWYVSTGFNLTKTKIISNNLASARNMFNRAMGLAEIGLLLTTDRQIMSLSPELVKTLGVKESNIPLKEFHDLIHPNDRIQFDTALKSFDYENVRSIEIRLRSADGTYRWYSYRYKSMEQSANTLALFGGSILDITQEHEKDILIERLAYVDEITEIANRNKLVDVGEEIYETSQLLGYSYWIMVLDIDRFHIINDTCGYNNGNSILRDFAHILYKFVTPGGLAARISGDNFALILRDYGDNDLPLRTFNSIQEEFDKLSVDELASIKLSCSAGYSKMPDDGDSFLDVLEHAEFALKTGRNNLGSIFAYESSMHDSIIGNSELEKSLALAIENEELQLFYQPKIDLSTGKIMGVEALIRWIKPDGTVVRPDEFVPVAESSHLIGKISEFVLNEGCRQNKLWQKMGYPNIVMSINFASSDFYQTDLKDKVYEALVSSGLAPEWLEVELTETLALSDIDFAVSQMNRLRELGVKLAMDDFGTGYSSLSYLQTLPITLLKLDRSFITDIEHDNIAYEIVSAVIRIAKSKKIETIAEGIENTTQQAILRNAGCDYGQGYLYGKPMPAEKMLEFFEQNAKTVSY